MRLFKQVDVFTTTPYRGNPLAVVLDGDGLSTEEVQRFAQLAPLPRRTHPADPGDMGPVVAEIMSKARLNAPTRGKDHEGPGFSSESILFGRVRRLSPGGG